MCQNTYQINCPECGYIVDVVNPRPNETPSSVELSTSGMAWLPTLTVVTVACSSCRESGRRYYKFSVRFAYFG